MHITVICDKAAACLLLLVCAKEYLLVLPVVILVVTDCTMQMKAQDIAGSMKADKQNLRMEELDLLFQSPSHQ